MAPRTLHRIVDLDPRSAAPAPAPVPDVARYVGKVDLAEVLVTGWRRLDDLTDSVTVHWPRHHSFYAPAPHGYGLMLFTESVRQALAVASHAGLDIPLGHRMGWETLSCAVAPDALGTGTGPAVVELTVTHETVARRRSGLVRLTAQVRATRDGMRLGTARVQYTAYPPSLYDRLRGSHANAKEAFARALPPGPALDPALVGRTHARDVTLAPDTSQGVDGARRRWALRADTTHSVLFDHPHDHIPGMVLLEAASQAVQADAAPRRVVPIALDTTFYRYVEFDLPCAVVADEAESDDSGLRRQLVSGIQDGETVFAAQVTSVVADGLSITEAR
ncbi:ScbA/BarX family gamma-butyrolactone biosynthesis protein [Streptomyces sp. NPDC006551]|uniref:ScbA/BarX family gamma-butyrolactone biosynthesis protein n=1 Tax=Streptomyces sp. NPDC006551 TaxID=3157178 RepID=UPI0033B60B95